MSFVIKLKKEEIAKEQSSIIFKDFITSVSSSTKAGYSIINAFDKAEYETIKSHGDSKNVMLVYISKLNSELDLGFELDVALTNFENRCELNDVSTFCSNIKIINEKGGSVISIIDKVVQSILDRVRMRQEIKTLTAAKKLEATLLTWFPFVIGLALYLISPNYFEPLLESLMGQVLLFMAFVFLVLNGLISRKIVRIEI